MKNLIKGTTLIGLGLALFWAALGYIAGIEVTISGLNLFGAAVLITWGVMVFFDDR